MERRNDPPQVDPTDPMALWVGTWMPEDVIDRETRRLSESPRSPDERSDD